MAESLLELRPKRSSFIFQRVVPVAITFGALAVAVGGFLLVRGQPAGLGVAALAWVVVIAWSAWTAGVAFRKERYEVHDGRIVAHSGGVFSDRQIDLDFRNVTHVKQRLPWVRYRFFDVGDVLVDSAGSSADAVVLRSVHDPDGVYAMIRERLQANGYQLRQQTLLHEEQPDPLGVAVEVAGLTVGLVLGIVWLFGSLLIEVTGDIDSVSELFDGSVARLPALIRFGLFYVGPAISLVAGVATLGLRYLDLRRRTYQVFDDMVVYREGFLSRNNAFIPFENIADADVVRTFVDQILGLADVKVSCQGSGQEVKFRRLKRADEVKAAVGRLVAAASAQDKRRPEPGADAPIASQERAHARPKGPAPIPAAEAWTATLEPYPLRSAASTLLLVPLVPIWLVAIIWAWAWAAATTYSITPTSVGIRSGILGTTERQYSYDKVTGAVVKSSPLDRILRTITIQIWSIGSTAPLDIAHVRQDDVDVQRLLRQLGIEAAPPIRTLAIAFGPSAWFKAQAAGFVALGVLVLAILGLAFVVDQPAVSALALFVVPVLVASYLYRRRWCAGQACTLHESHVELRRGIWWREHFHARYDDLKKVELTRYPAGAVGRVRLFVAGERLVQQGKNNSAPMPYTLNVRYVDQVDAFATWLDDVVEGLRTANDETPVQPRPVHMEARPMLANALVPTLLVSFVLLPIAPLLVPYVIASIRRVRYRLERGRVVRTEGILYRRQTSVLYDRIDSLRQQQGALGKVFGNGGVTVFTAGSSRPDLNLSAIADYAEFYRALREAHGGA